MFHTPKGIGQVEICNVTRLVVVFCMGKNLMHYLGVFNTSVDALEESFLHGWIYHIVRYEK